MSRGKPEPDSWPAFNDMVRAPHQLVAMVFGLGLSRFWPGTLGTLAGFALFGLLQPLPLAYRIPVYALLVMVASWASRRTGDDLGMPDHNSIVVDETIGMSLVLEFAPPDPLFWFIGFLFFRLFDVFKPWPVHLAHGRGNGGFLVILDDLLAAAYAAVAVNVAFAALHINS